MTLQQYEAWLNQATAGSLIVYHTGELARDRGRYAAQMEWVPNPTVDPLARRVYEDAERGLVTLTQKPMTFEWHTSDAVVSKRVFSYRAQRTSKEM